MSVSAIFLFLQKHVSEDYKQSVLSVIFRMIKKEDEDHMCVWIWACVYMCFFNLFRVGFCRGPAGVHEPLSWDRFTCDQDQQMTRWHGHIAADPQTNHRFKGHFKRRSERQADGAWKILCRLLFSICNHSAWFALSFCDAWNVVQGFVKFSGGTDVLRLWNVKSENYL